MNIYRSVFVGSGVAAALLVLLVLAACAPAAAPTTPAPAPTTIPPAATTAAPASATPSAVTVTGPAIKLARVQGFGLFLTDEADRTLYAFDNDKKDTSNCTGNCLQNWPPYTVSTTPQATQGISATLITTFTRTDGKTQVEYDGHPLYYYSGDKNPGDFKGHGVANLWHVLSPRGSPMTNAAPAPTKAP